MTKLSYFTEPGISIRRFTHHIKCKRSGYGPNLYYNSPKIHDYGITAYGYRLNVTYDDLKYEKMENKNAYDYDGIRPYAYNLFHGTYVPYRTVFAGGRMTYKNNRDKDYDAPVSLTESETEDWIRLVNEYIHAENRFMSAFTIGELNALFDKVYKRNFPTLFQKISMKFSKK